MVNNNNNKEEINRSKIIILSSPSGGGKTTIAKLLEKRNPNMKISISATTRKQEKNEINGIDYFFLSQEEFKKKIEAGKFLEYARIYDNYYGTLEDFVYSNVKDSKNLIFDIDWQGNLSIREKIKDLHIISFFILPPSLDILEARLRKREREDDNLIDIRLNKAKEEITHQNEYDYIVINDELERAVEEIENIISIHIS